MNTRSKTVVPTADLEVLMGSMDVSVVSLSECLVSPGYRLSLGAADAPGLHYLLAGTGRMVVEGGPVVDLAPHTLVVMPPGHAFSIEAPVAGATAPLRVVDGRAQECSIDGVRRFVAGQDDPRMILVCGYFHARLGSSDVFQKLVAPIVECFSARDRVDQRMRAALDELTAQEAGAAAMSATLLKQVMLMLLRRSLGSLDLWVERFSTLSDPQIGRAFAAMVAHPGAPHTVASLAETACLSRSAFMSRFATVLGQPPMLLLRDLRMRQAAAELGVGSQGVERVSRNAGYASKSSFVRAFRLTYGVDPATYRASPRQAVPR